MASLDDLYKEVILDHYRRPRHRGALDAPPASRAKGFNPLCGDEVDVSILVDDEGRIAEVAVDGRGCAISQASASMMTELVSGHTIDEARTAFRRFKVMLGVDEEDPEHRYLPDQEPGSQLGDAESLQGVKQFPSRIKCATLGWNTLEEALAGGEGFIET